MKTTVVNRPRKGAVTAPGSKSEAHRALICAALSEGENEIFCAGISKDISATVGCLRALGADITVSDGVLRVGRADRSPKGRRILPCGESGSTLRFLLPLIGALSAEATFLTEGRLLQRPIEPLVACLSAHGADISLGDGIRCTGSLTAGEYVIPGDISSQFVSGLLFALPLLSGDSSLVVTGRTESRGYITMTENAVARSGISFDRTENGYFIRGGQDHAFPKGYRVGGDWSSAAFFLCMGAFSDGGITVEGLSEDSLQGDREILDILERFGARISRCKDGITVSRGALYGVTVDASLIPDLVPAVSAVAAGADGTTVIENAGRLRFKESDRLKTTCAMLSALGADIKETADGLVINGKSRLRGGVTGSYGDHRIAMSAAVAAGICDGEVVIDGAECVEKSYPAFWNDLDSLEVL